MNTILSQSANAPNDQVSTKPGELHLAPGLRDAHGQAFAESIVVFSLLGGFFYGYMSIRLRLGAAFREADSLAQQAEQLSTAIGLLPPAQPQRLPRPMATPGTETRDSVLKLSERVQQIEQAVPGSAFDAEAYLRVAQQLVATSEYQKAIELLNHATAEHPSDATLQFYAGAVYAVYLSDYDTADRHYFQALALDPGYAAAYYNLACSAIRRGNAERARGFLEQAFALDPQLKESSRADKVWDEYRNSPELGELLS